MEQSSWHSVSTYLSVLLLLSRSAVKLASRTLDKRSQSPGFLTRRDIRCSVARDSASGEESRVIVCPEKIAEGKLNKQPSGGGEFGSSSFLFSQPCPDPKPLLNLVRSLALCPRKELPGAHSEPKLQGSDVFYGSRERKELSGSKEKERAEPKRSLPSSSRGTTSLVGLRQSQGCN